VLHLIVETKVNTSLKSRYCRHSVVYR